MKLFYFSGTGNTKAVCGMLAEALEKDHDCPTECISIESDALQESLSGIAGDELVGIGYPIYGFGCPSNMLSFVRELKDHLHPGQKVFLLQTAADFIRVNHWAGADVAKILNNAGIEVMYERIIVMGPNFFVAYDDRFNKQLYRAAMGKTAHMAGELMNHVHRRPQKGLLGRGLTSLAHYGESHPGTAIFGRTLKALDTCDRCGVCVKNCPAGNPVMTGSGVRFTGKCFMCMRCVYACHKKCITSSAMGFVILKEGYDLMKAVKDPSVTADFINDDTKGFYKHFNAYLNDSSL